MRIITVPWLPSWNKGMTTWAITISPFVFILREQRENAGLLAHEQVHLDQVKEIGWGKFYWQYITDKMFRASVEDAGYAKQKEVDMVDKT